MSQVSDLSVTYSMSDVDTLFLFCRLCMMLSVCGLVVLLPAYGTVQSEYRLWDKYTLPNVLASSSASDRNRVWLAVLFGYIFSAYFCQLLYNEYHNFSNERLRCLVSCLVSTMRALLLRLTFINFISSKLTMMDK
jgi:RsiW-degrading membrane proteinase PrsW (M82 family)